ncbi:L,D-transpeptidase [Thermosporothrix hazakensis]|jgi:hypothetical protein|nr:L,D-transpeptidase [Thermosporothrix hazakensis]GCE48307.1 hypothetical protein KTH_31760 [Thermosporothrix hazakensis]
MIWKKMQMNGRKHTRRAALVGGIHLSLLALLSACSPERAQGNQPPSETKTTPTPTISPGLTKQGEEQLALFQKRLEWLTKAKKDNSTYKQQYEADRQALQSAKTDSAYQKALNTLKKHLDDCEMPALQAEIIVRRDQLQQEVEQWGKENYYQNPSSGIKYALGFEYGVEGAVWQINQGLEGNKTLQDGIWYFVPGEVTLEAYRQMVKDLDMYELHFQYMKQNRKDTTPYDQPHEVDLQMMKRYGKMNERVIVVSLAEQVMRAYENGVLKKAMYTTTGRPEFPAVPGKWHVLTKKSPDLFTSSAPPGSPMAYPPTHLNYTVRYCYPEYYLHDSDWRLDYGPGTQFPHVDSSGNESASTGSHGCINFPVAEMSWIYEFTDINTCILVY